MLTPHAHTSVTPLRTATDVLRALRSPHPHKLRLALLLAEVLQLRQVQKFADSALALWAQEFATVSATLSLQEQVLWWGRVRGMTDGELQEVLALAPDEYRRLHARVAETVGEHP